MLELAEQSCVAYKKGHAALNPSSANNLLAKLDGWAMNTSATMLYRSYQFDNYYQTIAFTNMIAEISHLQNHHPLLKVGYDTCRVEYSTHSVGGLSLNDFICAAKLDKIVRLCQPQKAKKPPIASKAKLESPQPSEIAFDLPLMQEAKRADTDSHARKSLSPQYQSPISLESEIPAPNFNFDDNDIMLEELIGQDIPATSDNDLLNIILSEETKPFINTFKDVIPESFHRDERKPIKEIKPAILSDDKTKPNLIPKEETKPNKLPVGETAKPNHSIKEETKLNKIASAAAKPNFAASEVTMRHIPDEDEDNDPDNDETQLITLSEARSFNPLITETPSTRLKKNEEEAEEADSDKTISETRKPEQKKQWPPLVAEAIDEDDTITMNTNLFTQKK